MGWLKNMKIRAKLLFGFGVVLALLLTVTVIAVIQSRNIDSDYSYVLGYPVERLVAVKDLNNDVAQIRRIACAVGTFAGDTATINDYDREFQAAVDSMHKHSQSYTDLVNDDDELDQAGRESRLASLTQVDELCDRYATEVWEATKAAALAGDIDAVRTAILSGVDLMNEIEAASEAMVTTAQNLTDTLNAQASVESGKGQTMIIIVAAIAILFGLLIATVISRVISKPVAALVTVVDSVAEGRLNVNINAEGKDEIALLAQSSSKLVSVFKSLIEDLAHMAHDHDIGDIDKFLSPEKYVGEYSEVAVSVNKMVSDHINVNRKAMSTIAEMVDGNFAADMERLPGKKIFINEAIDNLRVSVRAISGEVDAMIRNSLDGNLSFKIAATNYKGDWRKLMDGLNEVMHAVSEPTNEVQHVMVKLSNGDFSQKMEGNYKGDFLSIKQAVNTTIESMSSYISEVSAVLGEVSDGNLTKSINREYVGSFVEIKNSINNITRTLHKTMSEISSASEQVLSGAKQISISSMDLAKGATMQASSVEELNASIDTINQQTQDNAHNAENADALSQKSTENAKQGDAEMKQMLDSMTGIKESSNNISKIIKVIEDIAFQTNLLALNAAVEAARAGEHGKGFAVVAEEVRNLASRSQSAAKETTDLIEDSINRVDSGTKTALSTASSLNTIVSNASEVSEIIAQITESSLEQAEAIGQVSIGLGQISQVIQSNSATSEEAAAAAQELNSQAEMLKQMVSYFRL